MCKELQVTKTLMKAALSSAGSRRYNTLRCLTLARPRPDIRAEDCNLDALYELLFIPFR